MTLRRLHPRPGEPIDIGSDGAREALDGLYTPPTRRFLRVNLITSVNGDVSGSAGTSDELSSDVDRAILGTIRRAADVVLVGASSIRAEGFHEPRDGTLVIVSSSGDFGSRVPPAKPRGRIIVACPADAEATVRDALGDWPVDIMPVAATDSRVDLRALVDDLRSAGLESIVCEGGPSLVTQLLDAGLVDELCLSTSPVLTSGDAPLAGPPDMAALQLKQLLLDDDGGLYARWTVMRDRA